MPQQQRWRLVQVLGSLILLSTVAATAAAAPPPACQARIDAYCDTHCDITSRPGCSKPFYARQGRSLEDAGIRWRCYSHNALDVRTPLAPEESCGRLVLIPVSRRPPPLVGQRNAVERQELLLLHPRCRAARPPVRMQQQPDSDGRTRGTGDLQAAGFDAC